MKKAYLFKTDGTIEEVKPKGKQWELQELQDLVGGYIETYTLNEYVVVLNEDGKILDLPSNTLITELLFNTLHDVLVGNVLITPKELLSEE